MSTPPKPDSVVDRDEEWAQLARIVASERPELVFVLGRRRVGKSFLLAPMCAAHGGLYYQASRRSEAEQLGALTRLLGEHFDEAALGHGAPLPSWEALLGYLKSRTSDAPFVLVLDEYPYLEELSPGLASVLQRWWDHDLAGSRMKLILAGSYITAMRRLDDPDQPLHARRTAGLSLRPFDCFDAAAFHPGLEPREAIQLWSIFGGLPGNLALIAPKRSLADNVIEHILTPTARLHEDGQGLIDGLRPEPGLHHSILSAVAAGEHTWRGITKRTGKSSGSLSRPLQWLLDMELLERVVPITESNPRTSKKTRYRVADPYLVFWHRFVSPLSQAGLTITAKPEALWRGRVEPLLDDYMGPMFERACRAWAGRTTALPFEVAEVGTWWNEAHEVDVVARSLDGRALLVGECKWGTVDAHDEQRLWAAATVLAERLGVEKIHLRLFAGRGPCPQRPPEEVEVLTPSALFATA